MSARLSYQQDHAENSCGQCGAAPGVVCEHDEVELLSQAQRAEWWRGRDVEPVEPVEPEPKIAKGDPL